MSEPGFYCQRNTRVSSFSSKFPTLCTKTALSLPWHLTLFSTSRPATHTALHCKNGLLIQVCSLALSCYMHIHNSIMLQVYGDPEGSHSGFQETRTCCSSVISFTTFLRMIQVSFCKWGYHVMWSKLLGGDSLNIFANTYWTLLWLCPFLLGESLLGPLN